MLIADLMSRQPATCRPRDSLDVAARLMWAGDCGCIPVVDDAIRPIAMITDRDACMAAHFQGKPLRDIEVREVMSGAVTTCREDDDTAVAHDLMREHQLRRLPVVDGDGLLVGIVSLADLTRATETIPSASTRSKARTELVATVASVTRARGEEPIKVLPARPARKTAKKTNVRPTAGKPASKKDAAKKKSATRKKSSRRN